MSRSPTERPGGLAVPPNDAPADFRRNVGILLLNAEGRLFLGNRRGLTDAWQAPQGGIDRGEDPLTAAWREMREEIGTDKAEIIRPARAWYRYEFPATMKRKGLTGRYRGQSQLWVAFRFAGEDRDIRLDLHEPEFDAWMWADAAEARARIVAFKRPVYDRMLADFADLIA